MASFPIPSQEHPLSQNTSQDTSQTPQLTASSLQLPAQKLSALARFRSFTGNLNLKNKYTRSQDEIVFPPPSWFIDDDVMDPNMGGVSDEPMRLSPLPEAQAQQPGKNGAVEMPEAPEPVPFALKIRQLVDSLPLPTLTRGSTVGLSGQKTSAGATGSRSESDISGEIPEDGRGPPIPTGVDEKLMKLLSSESVMNGAALAKEGGRRLESYRQSVWSALERLRPGGREIEGKEQNGADVGDKEQVEAGVMMYAPLEPTSDSEVELAESELEYVEPDESREDVGGTEGEKDNGKAKEQESGPPPPTYEKVWVPSTTKLSFYTTWWGYRLYLPPPVMEKLGSTNVKAAARATMITTALKWFLDRLPMVMVPPTLKPTVALLKRLSPLIGYIGVFVSWSWARITTYDEGNGVVLTATWLLPVALIPSSWDAGDTHGPFVRTLDDGQAGACTPKASQKKGGKP